MIKYADGAPRDNTGASVVAIVNWTEELKARAAAISK